MIDQIYKSHLGCIWDCREHAFAKENPINRHAIKSANQSIVMPGFNRMDQVHLVQMCVYELDGGVDPSIGAPRASLYDILKALIACQIEETASNPPFQAPRDKDIIQRNDETFCRLAPIATLVIGRIGHDKVATGIFLYKRLDKIIHDFLCGTAYGRVSSSRL